MSAAATVTDITAAKKEKVKPDNISLSLMLPENLYDKIRLDSILSKRTLTTMVEEWIDQNVSLQNVEIGLASFMNSNTIKEKLEPGVVLKGLSIPVSKRHYAMIRMEAVRKQISIRSLLKIWIQENTKEWIIEPVEEQDQWQERQAA